MSEVFSFTAPVTCGDIVRVAHTATFGYTVPASAPIRLRAPVAVRVTDGGASGTDTYGHDYATGTAVVSRPVRTWTSRSSPATWWCTR